MDIEFINKVKSQFANKESSNELLSLPANLLSLRQLCLKIDTTVYDIEQEVAKNSSFSAYILQLSNTAFYTAGKHPCENLFSAISRIGVYSVSQFALTFALQKRHELNDAPVEISELLKNNWQLSSAMVKGATDRYHQHRQSGDKNAKRVNVSDVLVLAVLANTGRLAVVSKYWQLKKQGLCSKSLNVNTAADTLNLDLLPALFDAWGLPVTHSALFISLPEKGDELQPIDYLIAEALMTEYGKARKKDNNIKSYNYITRAFNSLEQLQLVNRLTDFGILDTDNIDIEKIELNILNKTMPKDNNVISLVSK